MKQLVKTVRAITIKIPVANLRILLLSWADVRYR
jgi:hypothetical protein